MIEETIGRIEERVRASGALNSDHKTELLDLLATLKGEVKSLSATHQEEARSITGFTDLSSHEAVRREKNPKLLELSVEGLAASVDGFEKSHPRLVQLVNRICTILSNLGV